MSVSKGTVNYDQMSYADFTKEILAKDYNIKDVVDATDLSEAEKQAAFESQRYARQRYRDIWALRRDGIYGVETHNLQAYSLVFNSAVSLGQTLMNYRNPIAMLSNAFRFAVSTFNEIRNHDKKSIYNDKNSIGMQDVIWNHVYDDVLPLLLKRPIKTDKHTGAKTLMEIPEIRMHMITAVMNDEFVLRPRVSDGREVPHEYRKKVARLLDCQYDDATGLLIPNEYPTNPAEVAKRIPGATIGGLGRRYAFEGDAPRPEADKRPETRLAPPKVGFSPATA